MSAPKKDIADETWHVEEICNGWYIYRDAGWSDKRRCVAEVHHYPSDEGLGCANLIAAAPDLLAALEDCCRLINGDTKGYCHVMESSITDGKCWIKENRGCYIWSAIQKARGKQ